VLPNSHCTAYVHTQRLGKSSSTWYARRTCHVRQDIVDYIRTQNTLNIKLRFPLELEVRSLRRPMLAKPTEYCLQSWASHLVRARALHSLQSVARRRVVTQRTIPTRRTFFTIVHQGYEGWRLSFGQNPVKLEPGLRLHIPIYHTGNRHAGDVGNLCAKSLDSY